MGGTAIGPPSNAPAFAAENPAALSAHQMDATTQHGGVTAGVERSGCMLEGQVVSGASTTKNRKDSISVPLDRIRASAGENVGGTLNQRRSYDHPEWNHRSRTERLYRVSRVFEGGRRLAAGRRGKNARSRNFDAYLGGNAPTHPQSLVTVRVELRRRI